MFWTPWLDSLKRGSVQRQGRRRTRRELPLRELAVRAERLEPRALLSAAALDTTFSTDGLVTTHFGTAGVDQVTDVVVQSDGKVVVVGFTSNGTNNDFAVARLNLDGSLDTSFGTGGKVLIAVGSGDDRANSVAIQTDGRIVVAGSANNGTNDDFAVVRLNANGTLDTSFDMDGRATVAVGAGLDQANGVAVQSDGKIVVAGTSNNGTNDDFAVVRLNANGGLDTSFDADGRATITVGAGLDQASDVAIQSDGRIVVVGTSSNGVTNDFAAVRLNSTGSLDTTFDGDGKATVDVAAGNDTGTRVALQSDGKIVIGGTAAVSGTNQMAAVRLNANGSLDTGFDGDGKASIAVGSGNAQATDVAVQGNGKILIVGSASNGANNDIAAVQLNTDGSLDTTFDSDGRASIVVDAGEDLGAAVALRPTGQIVIAGTSAVGAEVNAAVVQLEGIGGLGSVRMFRAYNPTVDYHFFTTSLVEFTNAVVNGYRDETTGRAGFAVYLTQMPGTVPLHRLYNPNKGTHYYTRDDVERDNLVSLGWRFEKDEGFLFETQASSTMRLYRLYNMNSGVHLYTENAGTRDAILAQFPGIWVEHSPVGFVFQVGADGVVITPLPATSGSAASAPAVTAMATSSGVSATQSTSTDSGAPAHLGGSDSAPPASATESASSSTSATTDAHAVPDGAGTSSSVESGDNASLDLLWSGIGLGLKSDTTLAW